MWEKIADPGGAVLEAFIFGILLSVLYDLFRIRRAMVPLPAFTVFAEDILYCAFAGFAFFWVLLDVGDGYLHWWLMLAAALGWATEHFTLGKAAVSLARLLTRAAILGVWWILRVILYRRVKNRRVKFNENTLAKRVE